MNAVSVNETRNLNSPNMQKRYIKMQVQSMIGKCQHPGLFYNKCVFCSSTRKKSLKTVELGNRSTGSGIHKMKSHIRGN